MLLNKDNLPLVAMEFMNEVHKEDVDIINDLYDLVLAYENNPTEENDENLTQKYQEWYDHTVDHFKGEEEMMLEKGFPPYPMHKGEHENSLYTMQVIFNDWKENKDIQKVKSYLNTDLLNWLINHIQTMDTVTAMFFRTGMSPCSAMH